MSSSETESISKFICNSGDRLVKVLDGLSEQGLDWRPPAEGANSIRAIVGHALGTADGYVLGMACGQQVHPEDWEIWSAPSGSADPLRQRWQDLRERIQTAVTALSSSDLDEPREHPRMGTIPRRELLLMVTRHTAEHIGHAELTRDLLRAGRT